MEKHLIALLVSAVIAVNSIGAMPAIAAEKPTEEFVVQKLDNGGVESESEPEIDVEPETDVELEDDMEPENDADNEVDVEAEAEGGLKTESEVEEETETEENAVVEDKIESLESETEGDPATEIVTPDKETDSIEEIADGTEVPDATNPAMVALAGDDPNGIEMPFVPFNDDDIASGSCGTNATWKITGESDDLTLTICGTGAMKQYTYNEEYDEDFEISINTNIPWLESGYGDRIKSIVIEDGITAIYSFCGLSSLTSVAISDSVKSIGYRAFYNCSSLTIIAIPAGVTSIGKNAFEECTGLTTVQLPAGLNTISDYMFYECGSLRTVNTSAAGSSSGVTLPAGVTAVGAYAFFNCASITKVSLPDSVNSIGSHAFYGCADLTSAKIPNGVTTIAYSAFGSCTSLAKATLPDTVTNIGKYAFSGCSSLTNINIPDSVEIINAYAFSGCAKLTDLTVPGDVTDIYSYAFGKKKTATSVHFLGSPSQWENATRNRIVYCKSIRFGDFSVDADFKLPKEAYNFTGKAVKPSMTASYNGKTLVEGRDFKVQYFDNTKIGTATVHVNGIGAYSGTAYLQFKIQLAATSKVTCTNVAPGMKVSWMKVAGATRYKVYRDGELIFTTSALVVTDKEVKYNSGTKYTYKVVALEKNTGDSPQSRTATYYRLMPVGIKSVTNPEAGKMTVTYDRSSGSSGYVVRYGLKSDMSDAKVVTVKGEDTLSRTFSGLVKGRTYYVQVRTYRIENGVRYYSGYCTTKTVKIER